MIPYTSANTPSNHTIDKMLEVGWRRKITPMIMERIPPITDNHSVPVALRMAETNPKKPATISHIATR